MNLNLMRWLLAHRDLVAKIIEAVKGYDRSLPPIQQWDVVDRVARIVIPALNERDLWAMAAQELDEDSVVGAFALGGECAALGLDWVAVMHIIIPILEIILRAIEPQDD